MALHHLSQKQLLRVVKICAGIVAICGMVWMFDGCVTYSTVARMEGFNAQYRGFDRLPSEPFDPIITDIRVRVVVLPEFNGGTYSHPEGIITLKGKKIGGKIVTCPAVLGHEVQHALEYQGVGFYNPDQSEAYGY